MAVEDVGISSTLLRSHGSNGKTDENISVRLGTLSGGNCCDQAT